MKLIKNLIKFDSDANFIHPSSKYPDFAKIDITCPASI